MIRQNTGRGWDDWCDVIDAWPGRVDGHTAIATYVREDLGIGPWWGQGVTVGYERLPEFDDVAKWKFFWADWFSAVEESDR